MAVIRWSVRTFAASATLVDDDERGVCLMASEGSSEARVPLDDRDLLALRDALDAHLGHDPDDGDAW